MACEKKHGSTIWTGLFLRMSRKPSRDPGINACPPNDDDDDVYDDGDDDDGTLTKMVVP